LYFKTVSAVITFTVEIIQTCEVFLSVTGFIF
jgi:hypothetical protein